MFIPAESTILFQGDSITDMRRNKGINANYSLGNGYVYILSGILGLRCPDKNFNIINRGVAQDKIEDIQKRWRRDCLDLKPDVISILAGINNVGGILNNLTPQRLADFERIYSGIMEQSKKVLPNSLIILCEPFSLPVGTRVKNWPKRKELLTEMHDILLNISRRFDAYYLKLQAEFERVSSTNSYEYWIFDGVHPTPSGHGLIAQRWLDEVMGIKI